MNAHRLDTSRFSPQRQNLDFDWARQSRPGIHYVELPTAKVRVRVAGSGGKVLVFCPDPPMTIEHYDRLFELLTPWATVVCYEAPGFGFSEAKSGFSFTFPEYVGVANDVLTALDLGPCIPAMACVGTYIGLGLAAAHPEKVEKLVIMQGPHWREEVKWAFRIDTKKVVRKPFLGQLAMMVAKRTVSTGWTRYAIGDKAKAPAFIQPFEEAYRHGGCFCLASFSQGWFIRSAEPTFEHITIPTLVLWGLADRSHAPSDKPSVLEYVPQARYEEWAGIGHFTELEDPERFAGVLREFVLG
ncbi:MAG: alpha/beta hydrolase [Sphingobacteriaceae bacterium]|nr:alpha/beta hydrolase [Cytophagaceae bacterium]